MAWYYVTYHKLNMQISAQTSFTFSGFRTPPSMQWYSLVENWSSFDCALCDGSGYPSLAGTTMLVLVSDCFLMSVQRRIAVVFCKHIVHAKRNYQLWYCSSKFSFTFYFSSSSLLSKRDYQLVVAHYLSALLLSCMKLPYAFIQVWYSLIC